MAAARPFGQGGASRARGALGALLLATSRASQISDLVHALGAADPGLDQIRQWVRDRGYGFEVHHAATEDERLLPLFRLPRPGAPAVLLQHGVMDSAWAWVFSTEFKALGFQLHDAGYDVWLGNNRGNSFSERWANGSDAHKSQAFWDFTFDDMARCDVPAMIEAVLNETRQAKLAYIGHSQGTMQFLIAASSPELRHRVAERVAVFVALSPVAWVGEVRALLFKLLASSHMVKPLWLLFPYGFMDSVGWRHAGKVLCAATLGVICKVSVDTVCGVSSLDPPDCISEYAQHFPFGTSFKNVVHFAQSVKHGTFRRFDYGRRGNWRAYGRPAPPDYNLSNLGVPTALLVGERDLLADRGDVDLLLDAVGPTEKVFFFKNYPRFSHVTWLLGAKEAEYYVGDVLRVLGERHAAPRPARQLEARELFL